MNNFDQMGYEIFLKSIFPNCTMFPSYHRFKGWYIAIDSMAMLRFAVDNQDPLLIQITLYKILDQPLRARKKELFNGRLPPNNEMEPDFEFIEKLLKNHDDIGTWV